MKFNPFKIKGDKLPSVESLRPPVFNVNKFWFISLCVCFAVLIITAFIGFRYFHFIYFEGYKESKSEENFQNIINVERLKSAIEKRDKLINEEMLIPRDPSIR
jgi:hypothetical protein